MLEGVDSGRGGDPGHAVEAPRHLDQGVRELEAEHREREGDEGEIGAGADLPVEDEGADHPREQGRDQAGAGENGNEQPHVAPEGLEPRAGEIGPDPEEQGLAEGKKAGSPPAKGDPLADHPVEQVEPELVGGEARPDERDEREPEKDGEANPESRAHGVSTRGTRWRSRARRGSPPSCRRRRRGRCRSR